METIYYNGIVITGASTQDLSNRHDCLIVKDDLITHIGSRGSTMAENAMQDGTTQKVDLGGRMVLPGFVDGHMHLLHFGSSLSKTSLEECQNLDDIRAVIKHAAQQSPQAKRLFCRGWMHPMTNGAALCSMIDDLDDRPIFIDSKDLHSTWCNSAALRELGVTKDTPDPEGGEVHRDKTTGAPSGLLSEAACVNIVWPHMAKVATLEERVMYIQNAIKAYNAAGYTGIVEMATDETIWETMKTIRERENVPIRLASYWIITPCKTDEENLAQVDRAIELHAQYNTTTSPDFRITGIKLICDGVVDACTASLLEPYASCADTGCSQEISDAGNCPPIWPAEMLRKVVAKADAAGLQCALHAIGDATVKLAINTLEAVATPFRRHRIEHLEVTAPEDAKRLGTLGITASVQPVHADPAIFRAWPKLLGERRCGRAFAYREFLENRARVAIGTDSPTAPHLPFTNLYTATTRRSAREPELEAKVNAHFALSLLDAISAATAGSAYSSFGDAFMGTLEVGKKADFAVVDMDWDEEKLLEASVYETYFGGKRVYQRG